MIKLRVKELLEKNGKTKYWLYKQLGMSYQNFNKMINNETKSIRYENIETICLLLNCTPNDIFEIAEDLGTFELYTSKGWLLSPFCYTCVIISLQSIHIIFTCLVARMEFLQHGH